MLAESAVEGRKVAQRLGLGLPKPTGRKPIWLHASSVGEVNVLDLLVPHFQKKFPETEIVISTFTTAGRKRAKALFGSLQPKIEIFYLPLDLWGVTEKALDSLNPSLVVLTETELWPQFLAACAKRNIPVFLANGSLSEKSARRYQKFRSVFNAAAPAFKKLLVQTERHKTLFENLGIPAAKIETVGQTKYDILWRTDNPQPPPKLTPFFYWTAGSTRPGEEEKILAAQKLLSNKFPNLKLILAPRHLERLPEIENLLAAAGLTFKRTGNKELDCQTPVFLLDEMGILLPVYAGAQVAFVGGTLTPFGGHNLLEPLSVGAPVLFGPSTESVKETAEVLANTEIARQITTPEELAAAVEYFLQKKLPRPDVRVMAQTTFAPWGGVAEKTVSKIRQALGRP
ncbi:MAG TPA: glycosyltransferase N-terminal domain-containing protein [candidate division Zixibacteria bacterium]|nr:glycosyltransferase N-terminal domain-containing protein [candidate division Zixibacteria bacterium]